MNSRDQVLAGLPVSDIRIRPARIPTAVLVGGSGRPIVLLHGPGEYAALWGRIIPDLATTHRVIAPDLPGHGASDLPTGRLDAPLVDAWLSELIEQTCSSPPVIAGHLMGGAIAARYAADHSDRLSGLVLVDAFGLSWNRPALRFALPLVAFLARPTARSQSRFLDQCFVDFDGLRAQVGDRWNAIGAYNLEWAQGRTSKAAIRQLMLRFGVRPIPSADLARITAPTSLIWGRHDLQTPLRVAEAASTRYGWPLHVIEDARDDPFFERPDAALAALRARMNTANNHSTTGEETDEPHRRACRDRHHRRGPGRTVGGIPPGETGSPVPDTGCQRAGRRQLALPLGLAAAVQPGARGGLAGDAVSGPAVHISHQGRHGRLPGGVRVPVRASGPHRSPRDPAASGGRDVRDHHRRAVVHLRQRRRGVRHVRADPLCARFCRRAATRHPAAALERIQATRPATTGRVLVVGASHSGGDVALEVGSAGHPTVLSGHIHGQVPVDIEGRGGRRVAFPILFFVAKHLLTIRNPLGRKMRPEVRAHGGPLIRVKRADLVGAGVELADPRTVGVRDGMPVLADGRVLDVANVVWCTGFRQDFSWIDLPIIGADGWPLEQRGVVPSAPGLYFAGLAFQYAFASMLIGGAGRDAEYLATQIASSQPARGRSRSKALAYDRP